MHRHHEARRLGRWFKRNCGEWEGARGGRARRGDVKFFILDVLSSGPRHGYDIIAALEQKSGGRYRPSPGSVYPTLQLLEDGGFVTSAEKDGKRVYTITDAGRELLKKQPSPEEEVGDELPHPLLAFSKLASAVRQAAMEGNPETLEKLREILAKARREVYELLAEDE